MTKSYGHPFDPRLDLVLERVVDVSPDLVWDAWTQPKHLKQWFTPAPWKTVECEVDLRPGGIFRTVMESPEGERFPNVGCYVEVVPKRKLAWTDALLPGFRPTDEGRFADTMGPFTGVVLIEPEGRGTRYVALAIHRDERGQKLHAEMGFHDGWGTCLDQLVEYMKKVR